LELVFITCLVVAPINLP